MLESLLVIIKLTYFIKEILLSQHFIAKVRSHEFSNRIDASTIGMLSLLLLLSNSCDDRKKKSINKRAKLHFRKARRMAKLIILSFTNMKVSSTISMKWMSRRFADPSTRLQRKAMLSSLRKLCLMNESIKNKQNVNTRYHSNNLHANF